MHAGLCPAREKMDKDEFLSLSTETMIFLSFSNDYLLMPFPLFPKFFCCLMYLFFFGFCFFWGEGQGVM